MIEVPPTQDVPIAEMVNPATVGNKLVAIEHVFGKVEAVVIQARNDFTETQAAAVQLPGALQDDLTVAQSLFVIS
jgi:hypothetical protein